MIEPADHAALARKHMDRQFAALDRAILAPMPPRGWVRAIRDALGMTVRQLAGRMGKSHSTIIALEQGEVAGTVTLAGLRKAAEALDCTLHYVLIPNRPLAALVQEQARQKAQAQLSRVNHTMRLEDQAVVGDDLADEFDRLTQDFARRGGSRLWDRP